MLAIRLDREIEQRLDRLAKRTGRTKMFYVRQAILEHLDDLEDYDLAAEAVEEPGAEYSSDEVKRELALPGRGLPDPLPDAR